MIIPSLSLVVLSLAVLAESVSLPGIELALVRRQIYPRANNQQQQEQQQQQQNQQNQQNQAKASAAATNTNNDAAAANGGTACLNPKALQTASKLDGNQTPADGQAASLTWVLSTLSSIIHQLTVFRDANKFINFCVGQTVTNGLQVKGGSCNGIGMFNNSRDIKEGARTNKPISSHG